MFEVGGKKGVRGAVGGDFLEGGEVPKVVGIFLRWS